MSDLDKRIANLSPEQQQLLLRRLAEKRKKALVSAGGEWPVRDPSQPALLSFAQQQLWFVEQLQPGSSLNNLLVVMHIAERLDVAVLEKSFNAIVERHEALRTVFVEREGQPLQLISPSLTLKVSMTDLRAIPEAGREEEISRLAKEEASQPFDLSSGPLLRVRLLKLEEQSHMLVLTVHHLIFDGWSNAVLYRELAAFYDAFLEGRTPELPPLPIQYADYANWQRQWLQGEVLENQLAYWKEKLRGPPPMVELPTDRPRPAVRTSHGAYLPVELPRPLCEALVALSRQEGATLFMTLMAALKTLLFRYTQQTDVTTGYVTAGRSRREVEGLIGFFVNTLALRVDLSGAPTFRELLGRTRVASMEALSRQELPFEKLVDALQLERDLSRSPLFQVMFIYQPLPTAGLKLSGLSLEGVDIRTETSRLDITLTLHDTEAGTVAGAWEYNTDLFEASTITRLAGHYERLLQAIVAQPEQRITDLPLMTEEERRRVLVEWNDTRAAFSLEQSVTELFEAQARRSPEAVAVSSGRGKWTYKELSREAARLAARLRERGVETESVVGLLMDRSLEFWASVLAVFKAGGVYLPLDAEHPPQRIAQILERSGAVGVLVSKGRREGLANALALLEPGVRPAEWSVEALLQQDGPVAELPAPRPEQLAYVLYTSGSTGVPKGAMVEHRSMLNHLFAKVEAVQLTSGDVVAQTASQCFAISVWQFLAALLVGGQVHIVEDEVAHEPRPLLERLAASGISILETVPSLLRTLLEELDGPEGRPLEFSVLRWLISTGEALPPELCRRWLARYPGIPVMNAYGPTECTDDVTHHPISTLPGPEVVRMSIGRPVANMRLYVVDRQLRPVPPGALGELCIGGVGVGRGYLREPARTAEVFVPDPFSGEPSARLYRTGDLARHLPGGELEYLGRIDHQVKVRGFRIELGEIEAVLGQHPGVRESVVVVRQEGPGGARLVGYVVAHSGQTVHEEDLRAFVSGKLPEYMVPAAFVVLEKLPLTSSGKVDRKALPAPVLRDATAFVAPRTPGEELVAGIWAQLLGVARVGRHDNFFTLGGNSLLATQVASRLRNAFKVELPLRWLFDAPTVSALAWRLDSAQREGGAAQTFPLAPVRRDGPLPLSFSQQRLWFMDQLAPGDSSFNVPMAARVKGSLEVESLEWSLRELCQRHEPLRTTFTTVQGQPVQVISPEPRFQLGVMDLSGLGEKEREAEVQRRADEDAAWPFDLTKGPLLRVQLLRLAPREWVLLVALHHIVTDGWSMSLFFKELGALYEAHSRGRPSPLPRLPIQYVDYAVWQRSWLSGEVLESQLAYWRKQLAGAPAVLELPTDHPRPAFRSTRGAVAVGPTFPPALIQALLGVAQKEGVTLFMLLEAAFHTLLHRYSGQEDISVGTTVTGRTRAETEPLIGPFINTLVFRLNLAGDPTFRELLARAREMALGAYAHQDVSFEKLVDELAPERSLSHAPLFQAVFDKGGYVGGMPTKLAELELTPLSTQLNTTKFDLALVMVDQEDGMVGACQYSTDLFEEQTVLRMLGHLKMLLEGVAANPEQRLSKLPLLDEQERKQLLVEWNATETPVRVACLHELFEEQARRTPDAVAVAFEGTQLSYQQLERYANQLAHYLRERGVGPDVVVGLCLDRGVELVIGMLGILKAGGAWLPLDPAQPMERLGYMLSDTGALVLVTQERLAYEVPSHGELRVLLDTEWEQFTQQPEEAPKANVGPENLAYVIYTSGSTGKPKGVLIEHRNILNTLRGSLRECGMEPGQKVMQFASIGFDAAVQEMFLPLLTGGTLVFAPTEALMPGSEMTRFIKDNSITHLMVATPVLAALPYEADSPLRTIVVGGEACSAVLVERWAPGRRFIQQYGPTEASITAASMRCEAGKGKPPFGKPYPNTRLYVLDGKLEPVPVGVPGELYIGGAGVGRGYLGRPELTAGSFLPDPFSAQPGSRLYRTGDRVRYRADGNLEFVGRADGQVKLRGFRIELGEIEAVLGKHQSVGEGLVVVREDVPGNKRLVAYVVSRPGAELDAERLEEFMAERLPEYMVPSALVLLDALPLMPNGKVDRRALPAPGEGHGSENTMVVPQTELERTVAAIWQEVLGLPKVGTNDRFFDLGGNSLSIVEVQKKLSIALGVEVKLTKLFQYPTIAALAQHLSQGDTGAALEARREQEEHRRARGSRRSNKRSTAESKEGRGIAIIGMAGRFPGARNVEEFWRNLCEGVEARTVLSDEELEAAGVERAVWTRPDYVRAAFPLEGVEMFDAPFFGFNPREAEVMDPQHRLFLECAWEALERAGYGAARHRDGVGVFASSGTNEYLLSNLMGRLELLQSMGDVLLLGNSKDSMATRASFLLDLRGPAVNVQTACSSSLVAVHLACQSLRNGESNLTLAGGVRVSVPQHAGYVYEPDGIASSDGHCRAFDEKSDGTTTGSGVGVVVLKRLEDALEDGDFIHAVILESGINNDGAAKVGFTAPSVEGQAALISEVLAQANVEPGSIQYIEAHGTGTRLGDPIEIAALNQVFQGLPAKTCAIGSVKTNIGHTDAAAGVAGIIKTTLALRHGQIPASLHFTRPNPKIDFEGGPLYVNASLREWSAGEGPRRAGVSSFGMGGTNAHAVLEEAPRREEAAPGRPWQLLVLSARGKRALEEATDNLAAHLEKNPDESLADLAYTLQVGRERFDCRRVLVCRSVEEARQALAERDPQRLLTQTQEDSSRPVVFLFPGQGAQYVGMGRGLYETEPVFRRHVDECCEQLVPSLGLDLREILYASEARSEEASQKLLQTSIAQPALFVIEYALARLWMAMGMEPEAMMGHSLGEYVAACLAGVFSLEDALRLVAYRGQLMQKLPGGAMVSIHLPEREVRGLLGPGVSLAAVNAPSLCVASGPTEAVEALEAELVRRKVEHRRLHTSHAFHSEMMEPVLEAFAERMRGVKLSAPRRPYISNLTGTWMTAEAATNPRYWVEQLRQPVRFSEGVEALLAEPRRVFVEVGPGNGLSTLLRSGARPSAQRVVVSSLRHPREVKEDRPLLLGAVGQLWLAGAEVNWPKLHAEERRRRLPLPTYPFQRERYWVEARPKAEQERAGVGVRRKRADLAEWFYVPGWKRLPLLDGSLRSVKPGSRWLVFLDPVGIGQRLVRKLEAEGAEVTRVSMGGEFSRRDGRSFELAPGQQAHYRRLGEELQREGWLPERVVHLWGVSPEPAGEVNEATVRGEQERGFYSVLYLSQALAEHVGEQTLQLDVVAQGTQDVTDEEPLSPGKAMVLGLCKVLPQEHPKMRCRSIDVELSEAGGEERLSEQLLEELRAEVPERVVAYRRCWRWVESFEPVRLCDPGERHGLLRQRGIYLLTGGLGRIGLVLAEYLAATVRARLVLVGRSAFPERGEWEAWLEAHGEQEETSRKIRRLLALEKQGAEVMVARADISQPAQVEAVLERVRERFGGLHGVVHGAATTGPEAFLPIREASSQACENQFRSKLHGMLVLREALRGKALDFVVLQSSLASILGGLGDVAYSAANRFLDVLAALESRTASTRWLSVNWDGWDFEGAGQGRTLAAGQLGMLPMTAEEGVAAFRRILGGSKASNWAVSAESLEARLAVWVQQAAPAAPVEQEPVEAASSHQRPDLGVEYVAPRDEVEAALASIWAELLGMQQVGIHDSFFQLGGHSLLGMQLFSRMREQLQVDLPLRSLFESPTIAGLALLIVQKQASLSKEKKAAVSAGGEWPVREPSQPALLSFAQQRLWFMEQLAPGNSSFNVPMAARVKGSLEVESLEWSLRELCRRHESLRTTFATVEGQPVQVISPEPRLQLGVVDLSGLGEQEREAELQRRADEDMAQPFDLTKGPLMRVQLLRLAPREWGLLTVLHHIVTDGWSMSLFLKELGALYEAHSRGRPSPLPELPIQYADYAMWQRNWLSGEVLEAQLAYWRKQLGGAPAVLELPTDHPRPAFRSTRGAAVAGPMFPPALIQALRGVAQKEGVTLFMLLEAAFHTLLHRYSGQEDISVGTTVTGRTRTETESLIGLFVNLLVFRVDFAGEPTFRELLARVREVALGAYEHQEVPFEKLVDELAPERSLSHAPLFQAVFDMGGYAGSWPERLADLELTPLSTRVTTAKLDLTLFMMDHEDGGMLGVCEYSTDLFEEQTIQRMLGHMKTLLEGVVANPEQRLSQLPLLGVEEKRQLLVEWNRTGAECPRETSIHEWFEAQAERTPDALAVSSASGRMTYGELNQRANQLAHHLRRKGVGPEQRVVLCLERSVELVVGALGIMKAGGAYVPLDTAYPVERLRTVAGDSRAKAVVTQRKMKGAFEGLGVGVVCLDEEREELEREGRENPASGVEAENLAYVIYTSGSTGKPKGVEVSHASVANLMAWHQREYEVKPEDRATQVSGPAFDASVLEMWSHLTAGASLHIPSDEVRAVPGKLLEWMAEEGVTLSIMATPLAEMVLGEEWPEGLALRALLAGGDRLHRRLRPGQKARLMNHYGPTETTVVATWAPVVGEDGPLPSIGRPISNAQAYVLDEGMNPVPVGVGGELYIGGDSLARGYQDQPELTAERFIPNPFSGKPGERLYRTGDVVRWSAGGELEFLGRADRQVKVRGFRIELGEVEVVLAQHPEVREAVVVAREEAPGVKRLVAYVAAHPGQTVHEGELRAFVSRKLPEYMVPAALVVMAALPLTPNGKVDHKALPPPGDNRAGVEGYVAPRNQNEELLAGIWAELLGVEKVGIHDNFFELGGHSLLSVKVLSHVRAIFDVELAVLDIFEQPTVAQLAEKIGASRKGAKGPMAPPLVATPAAQYVPLSYAQQLSWLPGKHPPEDATDMVPLVFRLEGALDEGALARSLEEMVRRHEVLRTTFPLVDGERVQRIHATLLVELPVVDLTHLPEATREVEALRQAEQALWRPFDMANGPLLRFGLLRLSESAHVLFLGMHHILTDFVSSSVFLDELTVLYGAYSQGKPSPLPPVVLQYRDYTLWERQWMREGGLERLRSYWARKLAHPPAPPRLPYDREPNGDEGLEGAYHHFEIPEALSESARAFCVKEGVTPFLLMLAVFETFLARCTRQEDFLISSSHANRPRAECEKMLGMFANMTLLRGKVSGHQSFRELLRRVRAEFLETMDHGDMPYVEIARLPGLSSDGSRRSPVQLHFGFPNNSVATIGFADLVATPLDILRGELGSAPIDLALIMANGPRGFLGMFGYRTRLFEPATIKALQEYFQVLLECVIAAPEQPLQSLPSLPPISEQVSPAGGTRAGQLASAIPG